MSVIRIANDLPSAVEAGGKAAALARLAAAELPVPPWFAITPEAFRISVIFQQAQALCDSGSPDIQPSDCVRQEIAAALDKLPGTGPLAVRSSAVDEDGAQDSFAGQLESFLFVPPEQVVERMVDVWRSGFSTRVLAYRREKGLFLPPKAPAVLVQRMIDADVSGVAFAADPVGGSRSTIVISAVFGLGTALVGGDAEADTFKVTHDGELLEQRIARKSIRHVADPPSPGGVRGEPVTEADASRITLNTSQLQQVAELVLAASRSEKRPQDIEWAIAGGQLHLLQSRPITSLQSVPDPDAVRGIWDNSNIAESYNGITTPLTFSFARMAYEGAYRQFCRLMKVPASVIEDNGAMFGQMLGLIRGRIHYNLLNWYRLLAMLPGFSVNQRFMEQMMGVRKGLPAEVTAGLAAEGSRFFNHLRFTWSLLGLIWHHLRLNKTIRLFFTRLEQAMAKPTPPLEQMRLDQLIGEFRQLEHRLLTRWDAPLINDFLAMIFFGALGKVCAAWCGDAGGNLQNDLIADEGGIISTEPVRRIGAMAVIAAEHPALVETLCEQPWQAAQQQVLAVPRLVPLYQGYLDKFGDRCLEELKLESPTLVDDPTSLLRSIGQAARRNSSAARPAAFRPRAQAEKNIRIALRGHPLRKPIFYWLLKNARDRVRDRENLRFERTRLFGRVRRIFVQVGLRLASENVLLEERDIFFLALDEILGFVEGTDCDAELKAITERRKKEFAGYRAWPAPADRFETRGAVQIGNSFAAVTAGAAFAGATKQLKGTGCCPGVVRGPVRVIRDPRAAHLRQGEILVAERTDPGWIMLFPAAAGVLVERGSLLSHSAIVARELGIPAIVSIPNLMQSLADGQVVEIDGASGTITLIDADIT